MKKALLISFALLTLCSSRVYSQDCVTVKGIVIDQDTKEELPGTTILLVGRDGVGTSTAIDGTFEIAASKGDSLAFSFIGYERKVVMITSCALRIELATFANVVNEITIAAERLIAEEFTVYKIKQLDVYKNPSAKADPILAVNSLPSATTTDESANISLRGGSPAETGIFLNNVPIQDAVRYSQLNGIGTFSIFNTALIKNVQVFPGNPPLEYGNSTSGIIALETNDEIPSRRTISLSASLAGLGGYLSTKLDDKSSLTAFTNFQQSLFFRALNYNALGDLKEFNSLDGGIHYTRRLSSTSSLKLFNYTLRESYQFQYHQPTYTGIFEQQKTRNMSILNLRKQFNQIELSLNQGFNVSTAQYAFSILDMKQNMTDYFTSLNIHHVANQLEWKAGISHDYKRSNQNGSFPRYANAYGEQFPSVEATINQQLRNPEAYAYLKFNLFPEWIIGSGARKNIALFDQDNYLSVQQNITWIPNDAWRVIGSIGKYHKYILSENYSINADLLSTRQYNLDVNYTTPHLTASSSLFVKNGQYRSSTTSMQGVELFARYKIHRNVRVQSSMTSLNAHETRENITRPSRFNIHYFLRGNIEYTISGVWTMTCVYIFRQGSYYSPVIDATFNESIGIYEPRTSPMPARLPSYQLIDFSISRLFLLNEKNTGVFFLSVGNIVNRDNIRGYSYNSDYTDKRNNLFSKRMLYFGVVINW